jgi:hypothetical protein
MKKQPIGTLGANHVRDRWYEAQRLPPEHKRSLVTYALAAVVIVLGLLLCLAAAHDQATDVQGFRFGNQMLELPYHTSAPYKIRLIDADYFLR